MKEFFELIDRSGISSEQTVLRCTCTPKTYRLYPMNEESMTIPDKET